MEKGEAHEEAEKEFYDHFSRPFILTKMIFHYSLYVILVGVLITVLCGVIIVAAGAIKMDDIGDRDLLVSSDYRVKRQDAVDIAEETVDEWRTVKLIEDNPELEGMPVRTQAIGDQTTIIMYENSNGNVFTPENLNHMFKIEKNLITRDNEKIKKFCKATSDTDSTCSPSSRSLVTGLFQEDMTETQINAVLKAIATNETLFDKYKALFGEDFTAENPKSKLARSIFRFAMPLNIDGRRYRDMYDDFNEQDEKFSEFMYEFYQYVEDEATDSMDIYVFASNLELYVVMQIALKDLNWIFASFGFILVYMIIHTQSFVFPSIGMLQIIMSLPIAFFINRYIFQVSYFSMFNLIVLFLILGISADNIFIYVDTWKQSAQIFYIKDSLEKRFNFTYKKCLRQISTTTSTTIFNFIMTGITPILPIASFGFFAVSLVLCNYILVLSFYPAMFVIFAKFMDKRAKNKKQLSKQGVEEKQNSEKYAEQNNNNNIQTETVALNKNGAGTENNNIINKEQCVQLHIQPQQRELEAGIQMAVEQAKEQQASPAQGDAEYIQSTHSANKDKNKDNENQEIKYNLIENFFYNKFSPFLYKFRFPVIILFAAWFGVTLYFTTQLQAPKEATQAAPDSSIVKKAKDRILDFNSGQSDNVIKIQFVWGVAGIDQDAKSDHWDSSDRGNVIWDDTFDLSEPDAQKRIYDICQDLRNTHAGGDLVQEDGVSCFLEDFKAYVVARGYSFPVQQTLFITLFKMFVSTDIGKEYQNNHEFGIIDDTVKYVQVFAYGNTLLVQEKKKQEPLLQQWEEIMNNYNKNSPEVCNKAVQTAGIGWEWMVTEDKLISNTIISLVATMAFAFFVFCCSTLNVLSALFATMSIIGIVIGILGLIKMFGWYLGLIETIAASIVVGFSVEYIVFLCIYYLILKFDTRYQKMRQSLMSMGISILGGAITTLGAGVFLIMGQMDFFKKMGKLLICTIIFSILWSLVFFSALLMICGPMGQTGSFVPLLQKIKNKFKKKE